MVLYLDLWYHIFKAYSNKLLLERLFLKYYHLYQEFLSPFVVYNNHKWHIWLHIRVHIYWHIALYADYTKIWRVINYSEDRFALQNDLNKLYEVPSLSVTYDRNILHNLPCKIFNYKLGSDFIEYTAPQDDLVSIIMFFC